jgi:hypothetical protein
MPRQLFIPIALSGLAFSGCNTIELEKEPVIADIRFDHKQCHVHNRELLEDFQPAIAGLPSFTPSFTADRDELFPFAMNNLILHGPDNVEFARVMYCPDCRVAKAEWSER